MPHASKNPPPPVPFTDHCHGSPWLLEGDEATGHCRLIFDSATRHDAGERFTLCAGPCSSLRPMLDRLRATHADCLALFEGLEEQRKQKLEAEIERDEAKDERDDALHNLRAVLTRVTKLCALMPDYEDATISRGAFIALGDLETFCENL